MFINYICANAKGYELLYKVQKTKNIHWYVWHRAIRELKEETSLTLEPIPVAEEYENPYFTTIGMTDESCATVYGYASNYVRLYVNALFA